MDTVEATKMVMSRIQKIDPDNASKIMGYILIQDQGDNEMIRLAFGPESHLLSVIKQAKSFLDISSNTSSAHRVVIPTNNNGGAFHNPPSPNSPWSPFSDQPHHRGSPRPASYAAVVNGGDGGSSGSSFYNSFNDEFSDEFLESGDVHPHNHHLHRRSCSVNDMFLSGGGSGDDVTGGGWRPCMYYARGFCKNGNSCKFVHNNNNGGVFGDEILGFVGGGLSSSPTGVGGLSGSPNDGFEELIRLKAIQQQQQRIAAFNASNSGPTSHFPFNRCMNNFLNENPRSAAAALMIGDEFHKFNRCRPDRNEFGPMFGGSNSSSRQIYLTFPADSTFKEEDVSNYFSMFGPVQDVRIPYQQKRMFGFVTFMLPETVKAILAKGNPHFVCDSRVLVKPYKEKGKIPDKKHHQQMDQGDFSGCLSPTALESAEPFDHIPFGARMFNHEMMLRRKLEERELQHAIELQDRRLMNLQINDLKNHQLQRSFSLGVASSLPTQMNRNQMFLSESNNEESVSGVKVSTEESLNSGSDESDSNVPPEVKGENSDPNETDKHESLEHALPDNLFASPTKSADSDQEAIFSTDMPDEPDYGAAVSMNVTSKCQAIEM
uniref:zinc finger CCCH domain-containing protein 22-like n=1 Tax=Erigeron canadensis TaxID=72917 RepID=UPI001CB93D75|nr:zinc finger CCCH domain-containing protein 22-like [Erigeron canadensis]